MGEWKDGKIHGQGTYMYGKGELKSDKWQVYRGNSGMDIEMLKVHSLGLTKENIKDNGKMVNFMV